MQLREQLDDELKRQPCALRNSSFRADQTELVGRHLEVLAWTKDARSSKLHVDGQTQGLGLRFKGLGKFTDHRGFGPREVSGKRRCEVVDVEHRPGNPFTNLLPCCVGCDVHQDLHAREFIARRLRRERGLHAAEAPYPARADSSRTTPDASPAGECHGYLAIRCTALSASP